MAPFARDLGYVEDGPPAVHLGRGGAPAPAGPPRRPLLPPLRPIRDDAGYVLGTFPIVRRQDEAQFGRYRTRDLILAYMNALSAGDVETVVAV